MYVTSGVILLSTYFVFFQKTFSLAALNMWNFFLQKGKKVISVFEGEFLDYTATARPATLKNIDLLLTSFQNPVRLLELSLTITKK